MDNAIKKFIEEQTEKLAAMVAEGFASTATKQEVSDLRGEVSDLRQDVSGLQQDVSDLREEVTDLRSVVATKNDIMRLEEKIDLGDRKRRQEIDDVRNRLHVLETRVDKLEVVHR